jgi:hypothetical protein
VSGRTAAVAGRAALAPALPPTAQVLDWLRPRQTLVVLDNCEHLLEACARLADALLRACPRVRILTTSREGLGTAGERAWRVPSLALPDAALTHRERGPEGAGRLAQLAQGGAVRLFVDRAVAVAPDFALTAENAPAVAQVCRRLDGLPLAIELAAARVKVLAVEQIAARLDDVFRLLTGGSRTALPRQQTLRAAVDWSYDLLAEPERAALRRAPTRAPGGGRAAPRGARRAGGGRRCLRTGRRRRADVRGGARGLDAPLPSTPAPAGSATRCASTRRCGRRCGASSASRRGPRRGSCSSAPPAVGGRDRQLADPPVARLGVGQERPAERLARLARSGRRASQGGCSPAAGDGDQEQLGVAGEVAGGAGVAPGVGVVLVQELGDEAPGGTKLRQGLDPADAHAPRGRTDRVGGHAGHPPAAGHEPWGPRPPPLTRTAGDAETHG